MLRCDKDAFEALVIGVIVSADCLRYPLHGQQGFVCQEIRDRAVEVGKRKTIALLHIHRADTFHDLHDDSLLTSSQSLCREAIGLLFNEINA